MPTRLTAAAVVVVLLAGPGRAAEPSAHAPRYHLDVTLDTRTHTVDVCERVTWTNTTRTPSPDLVFSFYPLYQVPDADRLKLAKTIELFRLRPSLALGRGGLGGEVVGARRVGAGPPAALDVHPDPGMPTAVRVALPEPVPPGGSVTVELVCRIRLPNKQGRWGHYNRVTFLTNALPLLAVRDDTGWKPTPFVPWAQSWYHDAAVFTASVTLPAEEVLACPAAVKSESQVQPGWKRVETEPFVGRDFSLLCSARYREFRGSTRLPDGRTIELSCLAFPEHEFYATEILRIVGEAIPTFSRWFGPFPYDRFTVAESYFGWNGNESAGLVMIDERVFGMPHHGRGYVEYLVSHETCHQWWYNLVGTNGYTEPFLDEGAATYFAHRMLDERHGRNNKFFDWPGGLRWLPNVGREDYRYGGMYAAIRNGQMQPAAQELPAYGGVYGLFTGAYDRGSKVFSMIEGRLGEPEFLLFTRRLVEKYGWRTLTAADLRRELEEHTGFDWGEFFDRWVYGKGLTDWEVVSVSQSTDGPGGSPVMGRFGLPVGEQVLTVVVRQNREYAEPTALGIRVRGETDFPTRLPVIPTDMPMSLDGGTTVIEPVGRNTWRITHRLGRAEVEQVAVDPDGVLLDANPGNNSWKSSPRVRVTPVYTALDEADLTCNQDRWNFTAGPWLWSATYPDPWYTRSTLAGLRVGAYRSQEFVGGAYAAYRNDFRDLVAGVDGTFYGRMQQVGFNWEHRLGGPYSGTGGAGGADRATVYWRQTLRPGSSLYLPPTMYHETFVTYQDNFLPFARAVEPGAVRWDHEALFGYHVRLNLYTPYWDPETGVWADLTAAGGGAQVGAWQGAAFLKGELAGVRQLPEWLGPLGFGRVAGRVVWAGAAPGRGEFFALGGGTLFRGYDLAQRQGSMLWVANAEYRHPVAREVCWDALDHCVGVRNVWVVGFYDVGDVYANGRSVGGRVAHALGAGVRVDVTAFSFIERATLRLDVARTINDSAGTQIWFGLQHAF
jgi:hypothetical protein